jgi:hypothetical protein
MQSRAVRLILLLLFVAALLTTSFLFWKGNAEATAAASASKTFDDAVRSIERELWNLRTDQVAYASANQPAERWIAKVGAGLERVRLGVQSLRAEATVPDARAALDRAAQSIGDFVKSNNRAAGYAGNGDRGLAADVIFGESLEQTGAALQSIEQARTAELEAREGAAAVFRSRQTFAVTAGAAAGVLVVLLLLPQAAPGRPSPVLARNPAEPTAPPERVRDDDLDSGIVSPPRRLPSPEPAALTLTLAHEEEVAEPASAGTIAAAAAPPAPVAPDPPRTDFGGVASLCVDLARVADTRALPSLLDRTAEILDASGIILWIADPDGRELNPIFAQGYPEQLVNRLGTIPRDAENATAAAFRTSLLQTVTADAISAGAIAAPLLTPGGCVGVMAAEVRHDSERQDGKLAAATIVAAQLATLVGPPLARSNARSAGA